MDVHDIADHERTASGFLIVGTTGYMPPEQASGRAKDVTVAADIFSLGAILYELLTGQAPFTGESDAVIMQQVIAQEPPRPLARRSAAAPRATRNAVAYPAGSWATGPATKVRRPRGPISWSSLARMRRSASPGSGSAGSSRTCAPS